MIPPNLISFVAKTQTKETKYMTAVMLQGLNSAPEASSRFLVRSATALYLAVPWLKIHIIESILPARALFGAARCAVYLPDAGSAEGPTVSVV